MRERLSVQKTISFTETMTDKIQAGLEPFQQDRQQSRDLQLQGWLVLRFAGAEILNDTEAVVLTIEQAIRRKARGRANQEKQLPIRYRKFWLGGWFMAGMVTAVVFMMLVKSGC